VTCPTLNRSQAVGRSQLLARWHGTLSRILSGIQRAAQTVLGVYSRTYSFTAILVHRAQQGFLMIMHCINPHTRSLTHSQVPYVCPKCSPFCGGGDLDTHLKMVPLAHLSPHNKRHIDRSIHFCRTHSCVQQTNTHRDNPRNMGDKEQHLMLGTVTPISQSFIPGPARRYAPLMAVRSKNRGGPTSILGQVRSPHISGGRRWLICRQPVT